MDTKKQQLSYYLGLYSMQVEILNMLNSLDTSVLTPAEVKRHVYNKIADIEPAHLMAKKYSQ